VGEAGRCDPRTNRKVTDHEIGAERSEESKRGPTYRNRIRGADIGVSGPTTAKLQRPNMLCVYPGGQNAEDHDPYLGSSRLTPERVTAGRCRSEKSAGAVVATSTSTGMATRLLEVGWGAKA